MRISDWSSDVCSSDLGTGITAETIGHSLLTQFTDTHFIGERISFVNDIESAREAAVRINARSEERRVGKACVSTWRSRWSPYHKKKRKDHTHAYTTTYRHLKQ